MLAEDGQKEGKKCSLWLWLSKCFVYIKELSLTVLYIGS